MLAIARVSDLPESAGDALSLVERARAASMRSSRRRRQFVGGRFLLRALLEQLTGQPGHHQAIQLAESGQPHCAHGVAVSIAHSGDLIVCAASARGEVGVDVECVDPERDRLRIAREYFPAAEHAWLQGRCAEDFYRLWVLKEAWLKMRGTGIAGGLRGLQCRIEPPMIEASVAAGSGGCLSLLSAAGASIGLATDAGDHVDHENLILLAWRSLTGRLQHATEIVRVAGGHAVGAIGP